MHRTHRRLAGIGTLIAALMLVSGLMAGVGSRVSAHGGEAHPAHLHVGTCDAPGEVVFPLSNVSAEMLDNGEAAEGEMAGPESAVPVDYSSTTVQAPLADIIAGGHAIVVHESEENIANYLACGAVGGMVIDGELFFGLAPLNDSGYSGIGYMTDNGDGTTEVEVFLTGSGDAHSEDGEAAAGEEVAASIANFAFDPGTLEIAAGTTVTWTNNDSAPHTVSQVGGGFESGKIDTGGTFSFTFDTPGTYEYFCQYHPNMKATIVVS